jgi:hypothetical protein
MKRALLIAAACVAFAAGAYARDYTYLDPPTLAVADFEVSMSAAQKDSTKQFSSKDFYGQLISQALLSVLVQQNAAGVAYAPKDGSKFPGAPVYDPGMLALTPRILLVDSKTWSEFTATIDKANKAWIEAKDEKGKAAAMKDLAKAAADAAVYSTKLEELVRKDDRQVARLYFPTIFKFFDKKYVESALEEGSFAVKDLYTKAVGAFNFTDLDFLVLGNVYETKYGDTDAIGFNVRVLNTKRAEEVYSYSAIVDKDLHDLPIACAQICQRIMIDILNSHCAQLKVIESQEVSDLAGKEGSLSIKDNKYRLFWQPSQVEKDDNTIGDSDDSDKRDVTPNVFYWTLPGQYIISVYNKGTQQLKEIPFSIAAGEIRNIVVEKQHIETPDVTFTIGGIGPTSSYDFTFTLKMMREQYWWEIFDPPTKQGPFTISLDNGVARDVKSRQAGSDQTGAVSHQPIYRYENQDILIKARPGTYDVTVTRRPPQGLGAISGVWYVSMKDIQKSDPLVVTIPYPKDEKLMIDKFGLQEKQLLESPKTTKVTFILKPGFGYEGDIDFNDGSSTNDTEISFADKEKITITNEYTKDSFDSFPDVTYTVWTYGESELGWRRWWYFKLAPLKKDQISPDKDIVVFVDLEPLRAAGIKEATDAQEAYQKRQAELKAQLGAYGSPASSAAPLAPAKTGPAAPRTPSKLSLNLAAGVGYGSYEYYDTSAHSTSTSSGVALTASTQLYWATSPALGLGAGALFDIVVGSGTPSFGIAGTVDMILGDISKGNLAYTLDVGFGSGFTAGFGLVIPNAKKNGGLTFGFDYFLLGTNSSSFSLNIGSMF